MEHKMIKIRPMRTSDLDAIYDTGRKEEGFRVSDTSTFWEKKELQKWIKNRQDVLLVAEKNGALIGYVLTRLHKPTKNAIIENVYVNTDCRKQGIGTRLLEECLQRLKQKQIHYVYMLVKSNAQTIALIKSLGFKQGYTFTWMEKVLK